MKKIILTALFLIAFNIYFFPAYAIAAEDPEIKAASALLIEQTTGSVLYSKNASEMAEPASITKIMTALVAAEACESGKIDPSDTVTVSNKAFFDIEYQSSFKFLEGEKLKFYDILACCIISSVNETCNMVAEHVAGDSESFVSLMNEYAVRLGCTGTNFSNTHGLPAENHYTTAEDIYRIVSAAMEYPMLAELESSKSYTIEATNLSGARQLTTTNKLLDEGSNYFYKYAVGGKTGYTSNAGYCLYSYAEKGDIKLISIILGAEGIKNEDESTTVMSFVEARRLLNWGFESFGWRTVLGTSDLVAEVPVLMGDGAKSVILRPQSPVTLYMDLSIPDNSIRREITIYSNDKLSAPISAGEILGEVTLSYNGISLGTTKLVANTSVKLLRIEYMRSEIISLFDSTWVKLMLLAAAVIIILYIVFLIRHNRIRKRKLAEDRARLKAEEALDSSNNIIDINALRHRR